MFAQNKYHFLEEKYLPANHSSIIIVAPTCSWVSNGSAFGQTQWATEP